MTNYCIQNGPSTQAHIGAPISAPTLCGRWRNIMDTVSGEGLHRVPGVKLCPDCERLHQEGAGRGKAGLVPIQGILAEVLRGIEPLRRNVSDREFLAKEDALYARRGDGPLPDRREHDGDRRRHPGAGYGQAAARDPHNHRITQRRSWEQNRGRLQPVDEKEMDDFLDRFTVEE